MTSFISWIDPEGLAQTLARVNRGRRREDTLHRERPSERSDPSPGVEVTSHQAVAEPVRYTKEFVPSEGTLRQRLKAFTGWLMDLSGSRAAFVVDRDGTPLVDHRTDSGLLAVAASFLRLVERINGKLVSPLGRSLTVELEGDLLMLIFVETTIGSCVVGYVGDRILGREPTRAAADALRRAFEPGAPSRRSVIP